MRVITRIVVFLFFGAVIIALLKFIDYRQSVDQTELGFITTNANDQNLFPIIASAVAIVIGIVFGYLYNRLKDLRNAGVTTVNIWSELKNMLGATNFYLALAASPIVFGIVIIASKGVSTNASIFLAFQNGFFWQNVMPKDNLPVSLPKQKPASGAGG